MTAGNSSQLSDGASAVVLASAARAEAAGQGAVRAGRRLVDPTIMGIAAA